jgi:hypothetical protein
MEVAVQTVKKCMYVGDKEVHEENTVVTAVPHIAKRYAICGSVITLNISV